MGVAKLIERVERLRRYESAIVYGPGEPLRAEGKHLDRQRRPRSLWTAIVRLKGAPLERLAREFYGMTRESERAAIMGEVILYDAHETNRVTVYRSGAKVVRWSVWIDPAGKHRIDVWP